MNQEPLFNRLKCNECFDYTVKEKDTLFDLLRRYELSILELKEANPGCDVFSLKKGQVLTICKSADADKHSEGYILKRDENLSSVAQKFNQSIVALLKANPHLRPLEIQEGISIKVPE